ncbi:biotin carboxylase N-terminal domain-containing protein [Paucibacter sp. R3-3]|uniref:Biotin carboxylase N-terminal domain-containing protein n=1 Tax=Roseateles agri TaxID=3098619 RepID=A0ABU5DBG1_9BURK|nr:biotin carboxylase N-terminal domain-containing protein [Paucibacter sp. R3-3]MDY0743161.1 biotin carboxylase N-terminal domain-containing protein [Paucibacter sp. R3-3]
MSFGKVLIANRGEIACRVIRTARRLGYRTVAVYSDADADAPHVRQADEALRIGTAPAAESYLNIAAILAAAKTAGADAVHPGYGFLSERADFAQACAEAGLVFIGPSADSIAAMGDKAQAKRRMLDAGVPCVPGYLGEQQDDASLIGEAAKLGLPLLVKAVAGGGGRGMRLARTIEEVPAALASARREAQSAFGDGTLMLERLIERGRHIEIQVFADAHGNVIHLGERDCSAQRRRQKVIEEAPSPIVDAARREAMGRDAVAAARAVDYRGAGTVEFIVDEASGQHHFLEMNTRLQVEHPVTEMITGLDLVEWQLRVAAGEPLPLSQEQVRFDGHAIEVRLYAEDAGEDFRPQTGRIAWWRPEAATGVRIDHGIAEGGEIGPHYDPMLAKLIAHGRDREDAIRRLAAALADAPLLGVVNNGGFLRALLLHEEFRESRLHTARLDEWTPPLPEPDEGDWLIAAALRVLGEGESAGPRPAGLARYGLTLRRHDQVRSWRVGALGRRVEIDEHVVEFLDGGRIRLDGLERRLIAARIAPNRVQIASAAAVFEFEEPLAASAAAPAADPLQGRAPVAGLVAQVLVKAGDLVAEGQALLSVEAMKMEMWLTAGAAGKVKAVHAAPREAVAAGALLVELEEVQPRSGS